MLLSNAESCRWDILTEPQPSLETESFILATHWICSGPKLDVTSSSGRSWLRKQAPNRKQNRKGWLVKNPGIITCALQFSKWSDCSPREWERLSHPLEHCVTRGLSAWGRLKMQSLLLVLRREKSFVSWVYPAKLQGVIGYDLHFMG